MTIFSHPKSFQELLEYSDGSEALYELTEGELRIVVPESEVNSYITDCLRERLIPFFSRRLVKIQEIYVEVAPLPGMPLNRDPDLVVLAPEHLGLMSASGKMAISATMPPPLLIAEVVSPYSGPMDPNFTRDYSDKPQQYAIRRVSEYWIIDPQRSLIELNWDPDQSKRIYTGQATFKGKDRMISQLAELSSLKVTAANILEPDL
ncbi:MAG: Uma2 family endonuclease [Leptolyngbyaceae cyanobacterium MO_188.B28]|nr:Uma2 family endonuclease [Leptolyngbyaceae cyanobacterium MO_188.B28]